TPAKGRTSTVNFPQTSPWPQVATSTHSDKESSRNRSTNGVPSSVPRVPRVCAAASEHASFSGHHIEKRWDAVGPESAEESPPSTPRILEPNYPRRASSIPRSKNHHPGSHTPHDPPQGVTIAGPLPALTCAPGSR